MTVSAEQKIGHIDLFLDDRFLVTLTNLPPCPGNQLSVEIHTNLYSYVVAPNDTLSDVTDGIAALINASDTNALAEVREDRITLVQRDLGVAASQLTYRASTDVGSGSALKLNTQLTRGTNFIETSYPARQYLLISGSASPGDALRAIITRNASPTR